MSRLLLTLSLAACSGGSGDGSTTPFPQPQLPAASAIAAVGATDRAGTVDAEVPELVVRVVDGNGRGVANARVSFASADAGRFSAASIVTDAQGDARTRWRLGTTAGTQAATATSGMLAPVTFTATAAPAVADRLALRTQPGGSRVGESLDGAAVVEVRDRFGNRVTSSVTVTALKQSGPGTVAGTTTASAVGGIATFPALSLRGPIGERILRFEAASLAPVLSSPVLLRPAARTTADRTDDQSGPQVKVLYVLPRDGPDRGLDTLPSLSYSVAVWQRWLAEKLGGRTIRVDTWNGALDIAVFRLSSTDADVQARGAFAVREIETQLEAAGLMRPDRIYAIYYDGGNTAACGHAAWPGRVAALYLLARPGAARCDLQTLATSASASPWYWEFGMLHEMLHALGIVSSRAPNHTSSSPAHVPEPLDLMYTGTAPWGIGPDMRIDIGGDDYEGRNVAAGLPTLSTSLYVAAGLPLLAAGARPPVEGTGPVSLRSQRGATPSAAYLPLHPPFSMPDRR